MRQGQSGRSGANVVLRTLTVLFSGLIAGLVAVGLVRWLLRRTPEPAELEDRTPVSPVVPPVTAADTGEDPTVAAPVVPPVTAADTAVTGEGRTSTRQAAPPPAAAEAGPYGPGSAAPLPDGSAPSPDFTVKGNATSMVYHGPESPYHGRTRAAVWFRTAADAEAAGFRAWNSRRARS